MNRTPFDIEHPQTWRQVQALLELHSHGATDYDREMRRRAVKALLDWATPDLDDAPLPVDSFDEWVSQAAIATGRVAQALHDCALSGCTDSAHTEMLSMLPIVEHLAAEFRRLVERAERNQTGDDA